MISLLDYPFQVSTAESRVWLVGNLTLRYLASSSSAGIVPLAIEDKMPLKEPKLYPCPHVRLAHLCKEEINKPGDKY